MGAVAIDIDASRRKLDALFPIDTRDGLIALLNNYYHVSELRFLNGDYDASNLLMDFKKVLRDTDLTPMQRKILHFLYFKDLTQMQTAEKIGMSQQAVAHHNKILIDKLLDTVRKQEKGVHVGYEPY